MGRGFVGAEGAREFIHLTLSGFFDDAVAFLDFPDQLIPLASDGLEIVEAAPKYSVSYVQSRIF